MIRYVIWKFFKHFFPNDISRLRIVLAQILIGFFVLFNLQKMLQNYLYENLRFKTVIAILAN